MQFAVIFDDPYKPGLLVNDQGLAESLCAAYDARVVTLVVPESAESALADAIVAEMPDAREALQAAKLHRQSGLGARESIALIRAARLRTDQQMPDDDVFAELRKRMGV
jgi:hypothetical protein